MSAILGRIHLSDRPVDEIVFRKGFDAIAHYGRDGGSYKVDGNFAMGQHHFQVARHFATERQPVRLANLTIVSDAILDNRLEVCAKLGISEKSAASLPDSKIILMAFLKWGEACLDHFFGDYAIGVWNAKDRTLFLARDHIGTRPLYWRMQDEVVIFGSDIRALVAMDDLAWDIEPAAVDEYLAAPTSPMSRTFFRGLEIIHPGSCATISINGSRLHRWWDPADRPAEKHKNGFEYARRLRELTEEAIATRLDTELPIGSHLSGGIDSTTVTILAQRQLKCVGRSLVSAYSWAPKVTDQFPDYGKHDERRAVVHVRDWEHVSIRWGTLNEGSIWDLLTFSIEEFGTVDLADELPVLKKASEDNVGVMLSGWGGDEGFSSPGLGYPASLLASGQVRRLAQLLRMRSQAFGTRSAWHLFINHAVKPLLPSLRGIRSPATLDTRDVLLDRGVSYQATDKTVSAPTDVIKGIRTLLFHGHIGERMASWAALSAINGYVYRYPLTDRRVLEFVYGVPAQFFMERAIFRSLAYRAVADLPVHLMQKSDTANERQRAEARRAFARAALSDSVLLQPFLPKFVRQLADALKLEETAGGCRDVATDVMIYRLITGLRAAPLLDGRRSS